MSIEVMKQMVEALESYHGYMEPLTTVFGGPRVPAEQSTTGKVEKAINAGRQAIAEAEKQKWVGLTKEDKQKLAAEQHGWEGLCSAVEAKLKQKNGYAEEKNT